MVEKYENINNKVKNFIVGIGNIIYKHPNTIFAIAILATIYFCCFDKIDDFIYERYMDIFDACNDELARIIEEHCWFYVLLLIAFTCYTIKKGIRIIKNGNPTYLYILLLILLSYAWMTKHKINMECQTDTPVTNPLVCFVLIVNILVLILYHIYIKFYYEGDKAHNYTLTTYKSNEINIDVLSPHRKNLVNNIYSFLREFQNNTPSFALGINASWGAGKSTFMEGLKNIMQNNYKIVDFNVWKCNTPKDINKSFFLQLAKVIDKENNFLFYNRLSWLIRKYLWELSGTYFFGFDFIKQIFSDWIDSPTYIKDEINKMMSDRKFPILVFIDDIDRLNKQEILEVFRLIRNTADFNNLIYIVAYDDNYIRNLMNNNQLADNYLKKIFQLVVTLPKLEQDNIAEHLIKCVDDYDQKIAIALRDVIYTPYNYGILINEFLHTIRDVNRFFNLFITDYKTVTSVPSHQDDSIIELRDFFLLELLHYGDIDTYRKLQQRSEKLLDQRQSKKLGNANLLRFHLKDDIHPNNNNELADSISNASYNILRMLFDEDEGTIHSARYVTNFSNYFCFGMTGTNITEDEFSVHFLIDSEDTFLQNFEKYKAKRDSLYLRIMQYTDKDVEKRNFYKLLLYISKEDESFVNDILKTILIDSDEKERVKNFKVFSDAMYGYLSSNCNKKIDTLIRMQKLIENIHPIISTKREMGYYSDYDYFCGDILDEFIKICNKESLEVINFLTGKGKLYELFHASVIMYSNKNDEKNYHVPIQTKFTKELQNNNYSFSDVIAKYHELAINTKDKTIKGLIEEYFFDLELYKNLLKEIFPDLTQNEFNEIDTKDNDILASRIKFE